ncbi:hypothetical protein [uncultured Ferrovibrio sp.]|jgi:hypothetical protein|uniref:hypothetical protein n=1 Tax=uncultured Ferrovibrio sp. TaxID=1576913 RepID=UPI002611668A|nr:hypothetical protein [uncultured Ferrovibrio sp.]
MQGISVRGLDQDKTAASPAAPALGRANALIAVQIIELDGGRGMIVDLASAAEAERLSRMSARAGSPKKTKPGQGPATEGMGDALGVKEDPNGSRQGDGFGLTVTERR